MRAKESPKVAREFVPLMCVKEVAKALCLAKSSVYRLIESGKLPCLRIGGAVRVERAAVERLLEDSRQGGPAHG